jgi:hypothetical protein
VLTYTATWTSRLTGGPQAVDARVVPLDRLAGWSSASTRHWGGAKAY